MAAAATPTAAQTTATISWCYPTGTAVAADPSSYERAEWPPHPARVFMALAAAWFESEPPADDADARADWVAERTALEWIEALAAPRMRFPALGDAAFERTVPTVYVPVNDKPGPAAATLQSAPAITRSKQARSFPAVWVGDAVCSLIWDVDPAEFERLRPALERLCAKTSRVGHSSSLVWMWVDNPESDADATDEPEWCPEPSLAEIRVRRMSRGLLDTLTAKFGANARAEAAARLAGRPKPKGAERKALQAAAELPPARPSIGLWSGYTRRKPDPADPDKNRTHFDTDLLILTRESGPVLPLASTLAVCHALHGAIMAHSAIQPPPDWVHGHAADGDRGEDGRGNLACVPLPFVGRDHADGHLLGLGVVFPRRADRPERGRVVGPLFVDASTGAMKPLKLTLGRLGVWCLRQRDWRDERRAVLPETWTEHPDGAADWASVTPVVLDKFPKADRRKDRGAWTAEVVAIATQACRNIGLVAPVAVGVSTTSWQLGVPRAIGKRRRLRPATGEATDAALGDGFPPYPARGTNAPRPQVHVRLRFPEPVRGPILLGVGRHRGYGLCKPQRSKEVTP
jgi:CRISPR-associated protein Csb2